MRTTLRTSRRFVLFAGLSTSLLLALGCGDSKSPSAPGGGGMGTTGTVAGTVILGAAQTSGILPKDGAIGLGGVMVRVSGGSQSATTDGSGAFTLTNVPAGSPELTFDRQDIHARGHVVVAAGVTNHVTISIVGSRADVVPGGHSGLEIEGLVSAIDTGKGTLTVLDQRQGAVVVTTDGSTVIRNGDATIPLSQIVMGNRVHVKALQQQDGSILATEIVLENDKIGGNREVEGSIVSVGTNSFVVQDGAGTVTVTTDQSTTFKRHGGTASFADLAQGVNVDVVGILQGDGTVAAKKVTIEG